VRRVAAERARARARSGARRPRLARLPRRGDVPGVRQDRLLRVAAARRELASGLSLRPWRAVPAAPDGCTITGPDGGKGEDERIAEALGSGEAARHLTKLTGMSPDAAATYAAFVSGRWALTSRPSV